MNHFKKMRTLYKGSDCFFKKTKPGTSNPTLQKLIPKNA